MGNAPSECLRIKESLHLEMPRSRRHIVAKWEDVGDSSWQSETMLATFDCAYLWCRQPGVLWLCSDTAQLMSLQSTGDAEQSARDYVSRDDRFL